MVFSKLTSKNQTTIPKKIRARLKIKAGDRVLFEIMTDGSVRIRKSSPLDVEYLKSVETTLNEWSSKDDEDAFRDL